MTGSIRRSVIATAVLLACLGMTAGPVGAQVGGDGERLYTGVTPPGQGNVLAPRGVPASPTVGVPGQLTPLRREGQVLPLQVSGGSVTGAARAPARGLALTGTDVASLALIGLAALTLGVVLTRRGRPRSAPTP